MVQPANPRVRLRRYVGVLKARTHHFTHRSQQDRPEYWRGALAATKQVIEELRQVIRGPWGEP